MRVFGVAIPLIFILVAVYIIGAKFPQPVRAIGLA